MRSSRVTPAPILARQVRKWKTNDKNESVTYRVDTVQAWLTCMGMPVMFTQPFLHPWLAIRRAVSGVPWVPSARLLLYIELINRIGGTTPPYYAIFSIHSKCYNISKSLLSSQCGGFNKFPGGNNRPQRAVTTTPSFFITRFIGMFDSLNRLHIFGQCGGSHKTSFSGLHFGLPLNELGRVFLFFVRFVVWKTIMTAWDLAGSLQPRF